ncbi:hypothetical protein Ciccas_004484 [Cichlidogyrus casuarinus]|uniref:Uncharacterized protein n=1 Tax=Cichlidogyrus casuarinus TaxID=1844966 RepID=A0ABD2QDQ6_9PLAT
MHRIDGMNVDELAQFYRMKLKEVDSSQFLQNIMIVEAEEKQRSSRVQLRQTTNELQSLIDATTDPTNATSKTIFLTEKPAPFWFKRMLSNFYFSLPR